MTSAEEIRDAAYKLLLSRTGGYYDIQELEDDVRIHCNLRIATIQATLQLHGFRSLGHLLNEMLGRDKLSVKRSASTLGSDERMSSHYCGVPDKERFELWRKQREAEDYVLEGNIRGSRQWACFQQDGVLEDIHYAMLKKSEGFHSVQEIKKHLRQVSGVVPSTVMHFRECGVDWEEELERLSINDARRPISLHELLKNFMRNRVRIHFRNLVAVHYVAKPIDALSLQQWKHYRRLEEERVYSKLFGEERSFSQASTAPERSLSASTATLVPPHSASLSQLRPRLPTSRPPSVVAMQRTPPQPPQRNDWEYLATNVGPSYFFKPSGSHFSFRTSNKVPTLRSNSASTIAWGSEASDSGRSSVASFDSATTSLASTQNSRPGSVLTSILQQNVAESRQSPGKSKHRVALPEEFAKLADIARNKRNGEIDEGALQQLEEDRGTSSIRSVVKSTPETLEEWREWVRHYGWMLLAQTSIEKTTLLMYNARIERMASRANAPFRYRITFPGTFKYNERLDSMAVIQVCRRGHDHSNSEARVASVEQVHPRNNFMDVSFKSAHPASEQWVDVFSTGSTLLPDGILNASTRLTEGERSLLYPNFIPKESLQEFIGRRENGLSRMQLNAHLNAVQQRAVFSMLHKAYPEHPFILRGPPGTGKSEAALELINETLRAGNKVLLCAQSSVPLENMAKRCLEAGISPKQVLYLQARGKPVEKRDRALDDIVYVRYKVCCYKEGRLQERPDEGVGITPQREQKGSQPVFVMPPLGIMMHYNLVICTTSITAHLVKAGVPKDHFSYVIVEDAGKVTEPELAMVVTGLKGPRAKLVLVGDPKLSGPVVTPSVLQKSAYDVSTFKRLTSCHGYASANPDPRLTATFTVNYRNAHMIAKLARPFYGNLELGGRPRTAEWLHYLKECKVLPEASNVVFFDAQTYVNSSDRLKQAKQYCGLNTSQSNKAEVVAVYKMVCLLLAIKQPDGRDLFCEEDVCVIVPYKNQVTMLQRMVQSTFNEVAVDTIQRYQGAQKRVIIVSTTRTNTASEF